MPRSHARLDNCGTPASAAVMRVDGPAALVQAVPYLMGFHPANSLVVVGLRHGLLVVTARLDLVLAERDDDLRHAVAVLSNGGVTEVVALVYVDDPVAASVRGILARLGELVDGAGARILDLLVVESGRWRSMSCADDSCCPDRGRAVDDPTSEFAAAATFAGVVVHADRAALGAVLDPTDQSARDALAPLIAAAQLATDSSGSREANRRERSRKRELFAAARASHVLRAGTAADLAGADVARFGASLVDIAVRDAVWMAVDAGRLDGQPLWAELARRLPSPYDAPPAFLFGWQAWRAGNGALAAIAARRAIESDAGYVAADLLLAAINRGVDPRRVPRLRRPASCSGRPNGSATRVLATKSGDCQATRTKT